MKKKLIPVLVLVLVLAVVLPASAATPAPGGPFSTAFRVQNLDTGPVDCTYTFYDSAGTARATGSQTGIAAGDSLFVYVPQVKDTNGADLASGSYSGVVGCTGKVAAVANFSDADSAASFNGVSSAATTWYAPGIYNNYFNFYSSVVVQNATSSPVNITLDIFQSGSSTPVATQTQSNVPGYASVSFEQDGLAGLATNQPYSGKITASGNVAPVVTIYGKGAAANQLYSYNPFQAGSTSFYVPVVMNNYFGNNSSVIVQNMGTANTTVSVAFSKGGSAQKGLVPGEAWSIYVPQVTGVPSGNSQGLFGATITSDSQPVSVIVNESNNYDRAASFDGFASGSSVVMVPALEKHYFNFSSSVTCQNLTTTPTTVSIEYFSSGTSLGKDTSASINQGENALFFQPNSSKLPANNWLGSAKITADASGATIACVVNQDMVDPPYSTTKMDQLQSYEGVAP